MHTRACSNQQQTPLTIPPHEHTRTCARVQVGNMRYAYSNNTDDGSLGVSRVVLADGRELGRDYAGDLLIATNNFIGVPPAGDGCAGRWVAGGVRAHV